MNFRITTFLSCAPSAVIDLPIKDWNEIKEWFVKWDTLHYTLDGENWEEVDLNSDVTDAIDWKRPESVKVSDPETFDTIAEEIE